MVTIKMSMKIHFVANWRVELEQFERKIHNFVIVKLLSPAPITKLHSYAILTSIDAIVLVYVSVPFCSYEPKQVRIV